VNRDVDRERSVGTERVLAALAETLVRVPVVDLTSGEGAAPQATDEAAPDGDRYIERGQLGRGGLGEVVEVFDRDLRRSIALKRPRREQLTESGIWALIREAQITAQLDHPNIPSVHSLGIDAAGRPFFTMTRSAGSHWRSFSMLA